ncbi:MAG: hypothetical protein M1837_005384 [Sclerophora amabilis]|nr:MAG: hypothetical protein M1837_005384 [Sclerophora amabilis]
MDEPSPVDEPPASPSGPDLLWTAEIEQIIHTWKCTGRFPFPDMQVPTRFPVSSLSKVDLRLIHHLASISMEMRARDAGKFTVWTQKIPIFLRLASLYPFVMHSLLSFSATHFGWITGCRATDNIAYHHRGVALTGLHEAIGSFSKENSDAVLAASMLLKWQFPEWHGWASLMQGTETVIDAMQEWSQDSVLAEVIAEQTIFPRAPPSPVPLDPHRISEPRQEDVIMLQQVYSALRKLETFVSENLEESKRVDELMSLVRKLRLHLPVHSAAEQFKLLHPLRGWIFWLPISLLQCMKDEPSVLVIIAHFYAVALAVEPLFPEVGSAYFGSMSLRPIEEIMQSLTAMQASAKVLQDLQIPLSLMEFPLEMVASFRGRMGWIQEQEVETFDPPHQNQIYYGLENIDLSGGAASPQYAPSIRFGFHHDNTQLQSTPPMASSLGGGPSALASSSPFGLGSPSALGASLGGYSPGGYSSVRGPSSVLGFIEEGDEYQYGPPPLHFTGGFVTTLQS